MRSYPCKVIGIGYEGRYDYILSHVRELDALQLQIGIDAPSID